MMPIISEVKVATTTANFPAFGRPAPSSFDTLTLQQNKPNTEIDSHTLVFGHDLNDFIQFNLDYS
jgi:hypothetical protein